MRLLWLDLETTGLQPEVDYILEVAWSVATLEDPFNVTSSYHAVLWYPHDSSRLLDPFVLKMHTDNGLLDECARSSTHLMHVRQALLDTIGVAPEDPDDRVVLAGATVKFDQSFLYRKFGLDVAERLSHRYYDVSAVKLFCRSLGMPKFPKGNGAHRAAGDVAQAIDHAQQCAAWLREHFSR